MRLIDNISDIHSPKASDAQSLLKKIIDDTTASLAVDPCRDQKSNTITDICRKFFEDYYVKTDISGRVETAKIREPLSTIEADLVAFLLSDESRTKPFLFVDHAGRGKSTILKYVCYYLYDSEASFRDVVLPVYISLRAHETPISEFSKSADVINFIYSLIKGAAFRVAYDYFIRNPAELINWMQVGFSSAHQGTFTQKDRQEAGQDPVQFFARIANLDLAKVVEFVIGILSYYSQKVKPIALVIDDADNFTIDIQRAILDFAKISIGNGFSVIVSLRVSTWKSLENDRRDYEPHISQRINWTPTELKHLLHNRLDNAERTITLQAKTLKTDAELREIVGAFIDLLKSDDTAQFLVRTSNYNLHSLMRKLSLMPASWHFDDKYLFKEQLLAHAQSNKQGVPLWSAFNLVLGCYRGTFQSTDLVAKCGLINCFCTKDDKHEPYTFFARLHFLARLRDCSDESNNLALHQLQEEYREIFGDYLSFSRVFSRTLYRLVQGGLVITRSCRRYQDIAEVEQHISDDFVYISDAGVYYLTWLITRIDYFLFMKDDIDWPDDTPLAEIDPVKVGMPRRKRHLYTLRALYELARLELLMLEEIGERLVAPKDIQIAKGYVGSFSARKVPVAHNEVLFTQKMLIEYKKYLGWSMPEHGREFSREIGNVEDLFQQYRDVQESFS